MVGSKEDFLSTKCIAGLHANLTGGKSWHVFDGGPHLLLHWSRADEVLEVAHAWIENRLND